MRYAPIERSAAAIAVAVAAIALALAIADTVRGDAKIVEHAAATTGGDPHRGEAMFIQYGCGSCHHLRYVRKATGKVGPSLDGIAAQAVIAGKLSNSPDNLERWVRDPQGVTPGTDMPDLHVSGRDARDITAFLYTRTN
ncbi:MAG: c-type cytochrome [Sphingomicrobium sp.]